MYRYFIKRLIDILVSGCIILILSPFLIIVAILIKLDSKGPVFYVQDRVGKQGKLFRLYKFRTMTNRLRDPSVKQTYLNDPDITFIGSFLRRFKIDELPQIWNVFIGDMSLIGPRPALLNIYEKYKDAAIARLTVRPGMTGLSQVNGNIYLSWEDRLKLDKKYVDNLSFIQDCLIVMKTFAIVLVGEEKFIKK